MAEDAEIRSLAYRRNKFYIKGKSAFMWLFYSVKTFSPGSSLLNILDT